jgi:hypothetical protein
MATNEEIEHEPIIPCLCKLLFLSLLQNDFNCKLCIVENLSSALKFR